MITAWPHKRLVQCQEARPGSFDPGLKVGYPIPQDPTACLVGRTVTTPFPTGKPAVLMSCGAFAPHVNVPPLSLPLQNIRLKRALDAFRRLDAP